MGIDEGPVDGLKTLAASSAHEDELERLKRTLQPPTRNTIRAELKRRNRAIASGISESDFKRQKRKETRRKRQEKRRKELEKLNKNMTPEELEHKAQKGKLRKQAEIKRIELALKNGQRVAIDLGYVKHCTEKDMKGIVKQFAYMQRPNREHEKPFAFHVTSCNLLWKEELKKHGGLSWKMHFHEKPIFEMFPLETIVYLSPDAEQELSDIQPEKVYVIGGIVDRTVKKGLSLSRAKEHKVEVRRLPLSKIRLLGKNVLNIDTMVQVLLHFQTNKDWVQVLRDYLPPRFLHPSELERRKTPYPKLTKRNRKAKSKATALKETSAQQRSTSASSFDVSKSSLDLDSSKASDLSDPLKAKP